MLPSCDIGRGAQLNNVILDRGAQIPEGMRIGFDADEDRGRGFRVTEKGRVLVTPDMLGQSLHFTR